MKKIIILGTGAQGSFIAKLLNDEPEVSEIVCTDINLEAAMKVAEPLSKARGLKVNASDVGAILTASKEMDIVVNALPPDFNMVVMEAALEGKMHYLDMASAPIRGIDYIDCVKKQLALDERFKKADLTALISAGSTPGTTNLIAVNSAKKLDECDTIDIYFFDNNWPNKFTPFWWSPETALGDMVEEPTILENGELKKVPPFNEPITVDLAGVGPCRLVDHAHEEPITFGLCLKGLKNSRFKYGGPGVELSEYLYKLGLLGKEPVDVKGTRVVPFDLVVKLTPPAPATAEEISEILAEGFVSKGEGSLIRVEGTKDGKRYRHDSVFPPEDFVEVFEKFGVSPGTLGTAGSAALFTKLFLADKIGATGVFPPEMLSAEARAFFLDEAEKVGMFIEETVEEIT
jgi:saccharopine dehydrogenase-like NADP-dependent oxidoreductase